MKNEKFEIIAKTLQGLEDILAQEIAELGGEDIEIGKRMVSFKGDKQLLYKNFSILVSPFFFFFFILSVLYFFYYSKS